MKLILFANHFPYHKSEQFLVNEFEFASKRFDEVIVYTLTSNSEIPILVLDPHVNTGKPLFKNHKSVIELLGRGIFNLAPFSYHLKDFFNQKLYLTPSKWRSFFTSLLVTRAALSTDRCRSIIEAVNRSSEPVILYFYWGNNFSWMLPYLQKKLIMKNSRIIIRFHRTDLYEYVNRNYAPLRKSIFEIADKLIPISEDGFKYLKKMYPAFSDKVELSKLGVFDNGLNPYVRSDKFTIVSVSFVTSVKRVELILDALQHCRENITWYHFGDGPLLEGIKKRQHEIPVNISVHLMGFTKNADIMDFYKKKTVDLFINVSSSEGLPVSIMEAASFGIPIIATDAGGTSEIVNQHTGKLLALDISDSELATEIESFLLLPYEKITEYRQNARMKFEKELNAIDNYTRFYEEILC